MYGFLIGSSSISLIEEECQPTCIVKESSLRLQLIPYTTYTIVLIQCTQANTICNQFFNHALENIQKLLHFMIKKI